MTLIYNFRTIISPVWSPSQYSSSKLLILVSLFHMIGFSEHMLQVFFLNAWIDVIFIWRVFCAVLFLCYWKHFIYPIDFTGSTKESKDGLLFARWKHSAKAALSMHNEWIFCLFFLKTFNFYVSELFIIISLN